MQLSRREDYAVRVILELAAKGVSRTAEVAHSQQIPEAYLAKIIQSLVRAGLVKSKRGAGGGVSLARPPAEITLGQVVEAGNGGIHLDCRALWNDPCPNAEQCHIRRAWLDIQEYARKRLAAIDFQSVVEETSPDPDAGRNFRISP